MKRKYKEKMFNKEEIIIQLDARVQEGWEWVAVFFVCEKNVCSYESRSGFGNWHISLLADYNKSEELRWRREERHVH